MTRPEDARTGRRCALWPLLALGAGLGIASPGFCAPSTAATPAASHTSAAKPAAHRSAKPAATHAQILDVARNARTFEEAGAYRRAAETLHTLRAMVPADADLDLALALDLARAGLLDSAAAVLHSPLMAAALVDTLPRSRQHLYAWEREPLWINGRFDGWSWYPARAIAEVAASLGHWHAARVAADACVADRPLAGLEWLIDAVALAHDGQLEKAEVSARIAAFLDPTLPEAQYLRGLFEWRAGHANAAQSWFQAAIAIDSTWQTPAVALIRARVPGFAPDSLPDEFLHGTRAAGLLTYPDRPKLEEFVQVDEPVMILKRGEPQIPDSVAARIPDMEISLPVLVDEQGRAALNMLPWIPPGQLPPAAVSGIIGSLNQWRFKPARKNGTPRAVWAKIDYRIGESPSGGTSH